MYFSFEDWNCSNEAWKYVAFAACSRMLSGDKLRFRTHSGVSPAVCNQSRGFTRPGFLLFVYVCLCVCSGLASKKQQLLM